MFVAQLVLWCNTVTRWFNWECNSVDSCAWTRPPRACVTRSLLSEVKLIWALERSDPDGCCCRENRWCWARAADTSPRLLLPVCLLFFSSSLPSSSRAKRSVMASSNHVTPTNCSWWPILAMDEDGKVTDGEECEEPTAEPKAFNKERLVLYHWTQSFASQKVKKQQRRAWKWRSLLAWHAPV